MPIKTNLTSLAPVRKKMAKEITLLSHGHIDKRAFPDGKITVYPWDLRVHDKLADIRVRESDPEKILAQLLPELCNMNGATDFYMSELGLIMMVSHAQGQDGHITLTTRCPKKNCHEPAKLDIVIPDQLEKIAEKDANWPGYDTITLPKSGDVIKFKPETLNDLQKLWTRTPADRLLVRDSLYRYCCHIVSVGNGKDEGAPSNMQEAAAYLEALSPADVNAFMKAVEESAPQLSEIITIVCEKCNHEFTTSLGLGFGFFR